jgi:hypothetical protein
VRVGAFASPEEEAEHTSLIFIEADLMLIAPFTVSVFPPVAMARLVPLVAALDRLTASAKQ